MPRGRIRSHCAIDTASTDDRRAPDRELPMAGSPPVPAETADNLLPVPADVRSATIGPPLAPDASTEGSPPLQTAEAHSSGSSTLQSVGTTLVPDADEAIVSAALASKQDRRNKLTSLLHHLAIDPGAPDQELPMAGPLPAPPPPIPAPPPRPPVEGGRNFKSIIAQFCAIGGVAALVVWMMVLSRARMTEHEAMSGPVSSLLSSANRHDDSSQVSTAIARSATPNQVAKAELPARPAEPIPVLQPSLPSPVPQSVSAEAGATPVAEPPSPPASAMSVQPEAANGVGPSSSPPMEGAQTGIASVSGPQAQTTSGAANGNDTVMRLDSDELAMLLSRAQDFLQSGDLASARLLLRRAAQAGDANAALMLGATFDPFFVHAAGVIGIAPSIAQARQWYEKAAELGSEVATERLARLAKTAQ